ncbi:MAG: flagellar basal body P-ring protein FlgI [Firmicutes bacterium]|nr:flagellar basal body P-ring protein FlgI [Bacillota bacterium]
MKKVSRVFVLALSLLLVVNSLALAQVIVERVHINTPTVRVKDVARINGVRDNQLFGLGLVIGLEGTGDSAGARANIQMVANMLEQFGISVEVGDLRMRNVAAVMVTADVHSGVRSGDRITVTVSSIGDARSLQGGYLLQTPLQAANGEIYAAAQGAVSVGGFNASGGGSSAQRNHSTVGMIPNGAIIERDIVSDFSNMESLNLILNEPDFTTASRLVSIINQVFGEDTAWAQDNASVMVNIPFEYQNNFVGFVAQVEELPIQPDVKGRITVNERTGTIVMDSAVRISTVAVSHGNLSVTVQPKTYVSQPQGFSGGETVVVEEYSIGVYEEQNNFVVIEGTSSVQDLVDALNAIGASSRDVIAILQAIDAAGALYGELIIL